MELIVRRRYPGSPEPTKMKLLLLLMLLCSLPAQACLWTTETDLDGNAVTVANTPPEFWLNGLRNSSRWREDATELAQKLKTEPNNREYLNDYGVALARTGQISEALKLFQRMEAETPGQYQTAANLGTVLELSGNNQEALKWIKVAMKRNPDSHRGTEWVHVRILEAKLACAKDPSWLKTHTVLGIDFGTEGRPRALGRLSEQEEMAGVTRALEYQLSERMSLVSPPDIYVGDLLFDLGNLAALTSSAERGYAVFKLSEEYGTSRPELLAARLEYLHSILPESVIAEYSSGKKTKSGTSETETTAPEKVPQQSSWAPLLVAPVAIVLALLAWARRRRNPRD